MDNYEQTQTTINEEKSMTDIELSAIGKAGGEA